VAEAERIQWQLAAFEKQTEINALQAVADAAMTVVETKAKQFWSQTDDTDFD
jgi:hypothetical protein